MTHRSCESVRYSTVINSAFEFLDSELSNKENDQNQNTSISSSSSDEKIGSKAKCLACDKERGLQNNGDQSCSRVSDTLTNQTCPLENSETTLYEKAGPSQSTVAVNESSSLTHQNEALSCVTFQTGSTDQANDGHNIHMNGGDRVSTSGVVMRKKSSKPRDSSNQHTVNNTDCLPHIELNVSTITTQNSHPEHSSQTVNSSTSPRSNCQSATNVNNDIPSCPFCLTKTSETQNGDTTQQSKQSGCTCGRFNERLQVTIDEPPHQSCHGSSDDNRLPVDRSDLIDSPKPSEDSDDDDDAGVYSDSYRHSKWVYIGDDGNPSLCPVDQDDVDKDQFEEVEITEYVPVDQGGDVNAQNDNKVPTQQPGQEVNKIQESAKVSRVDDSTGGSDSNHGDGRGSGEEGVVTGAPDGSDNADDVFDAPVHRGFHKRSESVSTTASELEFRKRYQAVSRKVIRRKSSLQAYQRKSERFFDEGRTIVISRDARSAGFGFHIHGCRPVMVSTVEPESPASKSGMKVGDILLAVNDVNIQEAEHHEVVALMQKGNNKRMKLEVIEGRLYSDMPLCAGYLTKQGGTGFLKSFKYRKRWFVLKRDHCLYYYKTETDKDPLGAIPLTNYTISKANELNKTFAFKAFKYGHRTYYFIADSEEEMARWAGMMRMAAEPTAQGDTWLDISSHNVGLPALSIKKPDCHGYLNKVGNRRRTHKRRYCVLKDACMYYYVDATSSTAQGVAHLHGYTVETSIPISKKLGFTLHPPEDRMRTFYFYADNETDMNRWLLALQKSISRWVKSE